MEHIDFYTSFGFGEGRGHRHSLGLETKGPALLITDLASWEPDQETEELVVASLHPGVTPEQVQETVDWPVRFASTPAVTDPPTSSELAVLRDLRERSRQALARA